MYDGAVYIAEDWEFAEFSLRDLKHVFVEKPDRLDLEQVQYLKKIAQESGTVLQLGAGYKYCPVYNELKQSAQWARMIDVRLQLTENCNWGMELYYVLDFATSVINADISKIEVRANDVTHCILNCNNGCVINILAYTVFEPCPKLELTFISDETVISADIFNSSVKTQHRTRSETDTVFFDAYCEHSVRNGYLTNFHRAIDKDTNAVRTIDKQFQNMIVAKQNTFVK